MSFRNVISYSSSNQWLRTDFQKGSFFLIGAAVSQKIKNLEILSGIDFHNEYIPPHRIEHGQYSYYFSYNSSYISWPLGIIIKLNQRKDYIYLQITNNIDFIYKAESKYKTTITKTNEFSFYRDFVEWDVGISVNNLKKIHGLFSIGFAFPPFYQKEILGNQIKFTQFCINLILLKGI